MNLHPYQKKSLDFVLERDKSGLFLDMGLGKTVIALKAIDEWLTKSTCKRILIIAPLQVCLNTWPEEIEKWGSNFLKSKSYCNLAGLKKIKKLECIQNPEKAIYIINRDSAPLICTYWYEYERKHEELLFDGLVVDESSSFKNPATYRFKFLRSRLKHLKKILLLSGTPISNSLLDIWSQICLLDNGKRLGTSFHLFKKKYFISDYNGYRWTQKESSLKNISKLISDICLSISIKDNLELPPIIFNRIPVSLPQKAQEKYMTFEKNAILHLDKEESLVSAVSAAALTNKLTQMASGAIYNDVSLSKSDYELTSVDRKYTVFHEEKINALREIIELNPHKNILVAYHYTHERIRLSENFSISNLTHLGSIDSWNKGFIKLMMAHPQNAAHGLNLQMGGSIIVWFSIPWSLEYYLQFNARLYRQGQKETVTIHHLLAKNTIDDLIFDRLSSKETDLSTLLITLKKNHEKNKQRMESTKNSGYLSNSRI